LQPFVTPSAALVLLVAYLATHAASRFTLPSSLGYDDAEQVLFAQAWSLGYRFQQPPLVTWLMLALREGLGMAPGLASVTLLRALLLGALHLGLYLAARRWLGDPLRAALASAALATTYTLGYLAHADLLVTTALAATVALGLWLWHRLLERPSLARTLAFGLICGLGLLAKWNFVMLALAFLVVGLLRAETRPLVLSWRTPVIVLVASLIAGPTGLWVLTHHPSFTGLGQEVLVDPAAGRSLLEGLESLVLSALAFPQPMLVLLLLAGWPALRRLPAELVPLAALVAVAFALHLLLIPLAGAVNFPERWMVTIELPLAILLLGAIARDHPRLVVVASTILAVVTGSWLASAGIGLTDAAYCGKCRTRLPVAAFVDGARAAGFDRGTVVVLDMHLGGNLQAAFDGDARVILPTYPLDIWPPAGDGQCLVAWREGRDGTSVIAAAERLGAAFDEGTPTIVRAPILGAEAPLQGMVFRLVDGAGDCR
jgi:4-amino-4-deoxy-L-arabinose transferase-like glycosyltransferase